MRRLLAFELFFSTPQRFSTSQPSKDVSVDDDQVLAGEKPRQFEDSARISSYAAEWRRSQRLELSRSRNHGANVGSEDVSNKNLRRGDSVLGELSVVNPAGKLFERVKVEKD